MKSEFDPMLRIDPSTSACTPLPSEVTITTAATPMRMPSTVSAARNFERAIAATASSLACADQPRLDRNRANA